MNSVTIHGRVVRTYFIPPKGEKKPMLTFAVADNVYKGKDREKEVMYWDCKFYGKQAGALAPYIKKGIIVTVIGVISPTEYVSKKTGENVKTYDVFVDKLEMVTPMLKADREALAKLRPVENAPETESFDGNDSWD